MKRVSLQSRRGAIILVALCFAAVLGISLASYLAISSQAMRLSNRSFQTDLSRQLAEAGMEQALAAFNSNDWTGWTISGTTATRTISTPFPSTKYGSTGVAGSIKLRVDNYNAFNLESTWVGGTSYSVGDLVGRNGIWYRCVRAHSTSQTPSGTAANLGMGNLAYWAPENVGWEWRPSGSYADESVVNYQGNWYRSTANNNSTTPSPSAPNWAAIPTIRPYSSIDSYSDGDIRYRQNSDSWNRFRNPPGSLTTDARIKWQWKDDEDYAFGDLVYSYSGSGTTFHWYRCIQAHDDQEPPNSTYWENALTGPMWGWSPSATYNSGDVSFRNGSWYRCIRTHFNQQPPNTTYWSNAPEGTANWLATRTYGSNDVACHNGVWYRSTGSGNTSVPGVANWASAATPSWSSATAYTAGNYVAYGGIWYRCVTAHTNQTPNNSTYWTAVGAPVIYSEGIATLPDGPAARTQLRANVAAAPLFPNALAGTSTVALGTTSLVDSYDATAGAYSSGTAADFSAVIAGGKTSAGTAAVDLSTATVKGYVAAPPDASSATFEPKISYSPTAVLRNADGTVTSPTASAVNVDRTRISRSPYIPQFDIQAVPGGTELTTDDNLILGTPGATTPSIYYYDDNMTLSGSGETMTIVGPVILRVEGDLRIRSDAQIRILSTGSLQLHVEDDFRLEADGEGIDNRTLNPKNLIVLLSRTANGGNVEISNTTATSQPFYGVVYMPNSSRTISVASGVEIYGAISAQNVALNGSATLHYDTSLRHAAIPGVVPAYIVKEWRELGVAERASL